MLSVTACPRAFPEGEILEIAALTGVTSTPSGGDTTATFTGKYVFVTPGTHHGAFNTGFANPILGADDFCANQKPASLRGTGTDYKAMIVDGTNRIACTNANCAGGGPHSSWIMRADTEYRRADDQTVFTTNSNAVFDFGAASLTAAFDTDATPLHWWTGLDQDWRTTVSGNTCVSWATNVGGFDGTYGSSAATDNNSISDVANSNFGDGCNTLNRLLCVEQ